MFGSAAGPRWTFLASGATLISGRGTQVVRERSAKPLCVGSIPTRASSAIFFIFYKRNVPVWSLRNPQVALKPKLLRNNQGKVCA
jgi:hypothetical protein